MSLPSRVGPCQSGNSERLYVLRKRVYRVTVKLFFGRDGPKKKYVDEALDALEKVTGDKSVERFIVSLSSVSWGGGEEGVDDGMDEVRALGKEWKVSKRGRSS